MLKKDVTDYFGSVAAVAAALGISRAAVYQWGEHVPESSGWKLQVLTRGALRADDTQPAPAEKAAV